MPDWQKSPLHTGFHFKVSVQTARVSNTLQDAILAHAN